MPTAATYARRKAARAAARAASSPVLDSPDQLDELDDLPEVGAPLPTITDIEQVMFGVNDPTEGVYESAEAALGSGSMGTGGLGPLSAWTTPEATKKGKNFVQVNRAMGGHYATVYDRLGNDYRMLKEDVAAALAPLEDDEAHRRRYLRCPRCVRLPNHGIHKQAGPNGCPAREKRLMTYCDICASNGNTTIFYEDHDDGNALAAPPIDITDPLFRPPARPNAKSREQALQMKLDDHIRFFHPTAARQRGLRKD